MLVVFCWFFGLFAAIELIYGQDCIKKNLICYLCINFWKSYSKRGFCRYH